MSMAVFRVHKNANYTVLSNYHFREKGMSLKAKGLLSLMLSLPEDWDYSAAGLVTLSKDGKDSVNAALKELEKFGYLRRTQAFDDGGKFSGYNYEIFEQPIDVTTFAGNPSTGEPFAGNPSTGNPPQLNNKKTSTKKTITKKEEEERKKDATAPTGYDVIVSAQINDEEVKEAIYEFIKMRKFIKKPLTDFALKNIIKKLFDLSDDPKEQVEILKNAILNSRADIYPISGAKKEEVRGRVLPMVANSEDTDPNDELVTMFHGNIIMSENQCGDLLERMDLETFNLYIGKLSAYIDENGPISAGHYATILKWYTQDSAVAR